jgi:hypothetical protein
MSYADVNWADEYFALRAFSDAWNAAGENKMLYLETATNQIKDYCVFVDEKGAYTYNENDNSEFVIPAWLRRATCEQALHLLNLVKDPTQNDKKTTLGIVSTDGTVFDKSFAADILCPLCRRILENNGGVLLDGATANSKRLGIGRVSK